MILLLLLAAPELDYRIADLGVDFVHDTGAALDAAGKPTRYLPETMGPGAILFDADSDGDPDLLLVNSGRSPSRFYELAEGRFVDRTERSGLGIVGSSMGGTAADYDGDGDQDVAITGWGGVRLFENRGGARFRELRGAVASPGWADPQNHRGPSWATAAAWFDADQDGDLDLLVAHYVRWSHAVDVFTTIDGKTKSFTTPTVYAPDASRLYLQENKKLRDATAGSGFDTAPGKSLGIALWDFDRDGRLEVLIANDTHPNGFFENLGGGRFRDAALAAAIAYDEQGLTRAGMGIDVAEVEGESLVAIGNFSMQGLTLRRWRAGWFHEVSHAAGVAGATLPSLTFGALFADVDFDGRSDLVLANGHIEPDIQRLQPHIPHAQRPQLLHNLGNGRFVELSDRAGPAFSAPMVGRALVAGDLDRDGDLDLIFTANGGAVRTAIAHGPPRGAFLRVSLIGRPPNRDAIGAEVEIDACGKQQRRLARTGSSYLSQSESVLTFGLGTCRRVDRVRVRWPLLEGREREESVLDGVPTNQTIVVAHSAAQALGASAGSTARTAAPSKAKPSVTP